jgi:hypothetical protein
MLETMENKQVNPVKKKLNLRKIIIGIIIILAAIGTIMIIKNQDPCKKFPEKLNKCEPFSCKFSHPLTQELMERKIIGLANDRCEYIEEMPYSGRMECKFSERFRINVSKLYKEPEKAKSFWVKFSTKGDYAATINGKEIEDGIQTAIDIGECFIYGYIDDEDMKKCPHWKVYRGESNGEALCADPNLICPPCENCVLGIMKKSRDECVECRKDEECKEGFHCFEGFCTDNEFLNKNPSCESYKNSTNDPCKVHTCENCENGVMSCLTNSNYSWLQYKCIECERNRDCKEGYKCERYKCITKQEKF